MLVLVVVVKVVKMVDGVVVDGLGDWGGVCD